MKPGYLLIPAFVLFLIGIGCSKGNTGKKPQISLESINTTVQPNDSMVAMFKFTNSGGTLGNGTFISVRNRLNQAPPADSVGPDTLYTTIPDFGGSNKGEFRFALNWNNYLSEGGHTNDTLVFKFYALTPDSASTDTISSPQIVIINP
jgi:hypothetical protein